VDLGAVRYHEIAGFGTEGRAARVKITFSVAQHHHFYVLVPVRYQGGVVFVYSEFYRKVVFERRYALVLVQSIHKISKKSKQC
jgi:hypothetical protein